MKLPDASWRKRVGLVPLLRVLGAGEGLTRYVGGCVRDTLLKVSVSDVDLATRLEPEEVVRRLKAASIKVIPTGLSHGTVTAVSGGQPVEVTTLRRDVSTDGRRATVAFTDDWREDAARRDFTINALSADPHSGELFDYFGGLDDLAARRVRFIGDPLRRIAEDHLRILRFFRFHARFGAGAAPDAEALAACTARANDLMALSRERIASELLRLLALPDPVATVRIMIDHFILRPVLPEIVAARRLERLVARERECGLEPQPIRRLASLIPEDPGIAESIAHRLRLSSGQRMVLAGDCDRTNWRSGSAFQRAYRVGLETAIDRLLLSEEPLALVREQVRLLSSQPLPELPIKGSDLIAMGLPRGPLVSRVMAQVGEQWVNEDFPPAQRLQEIAQAAVDEALRSSR